MWFDSHCHVYDCPGGPEEAIDRARAAGVAEILVAGTDAASSEVARDLAARAGVYAAAGVHPNSSSGWGRRDVDVVAELAGDDRVVAVGETGLDFYREAAPEDDQRAAFSAHIELAGAHGKALVIHTRDSVDAALEVIDRAHVRPRHVWHCWSGNRGQLERALDLGGFVSFAGNVTFTRNEELRALAAAVPGDRLLVETDSPYLTPVPHRGRPNEPAHVTLVGAAVARSRGIAPDEIASITRANARSLFGLDQVSVPR